MPRNKMVVHVFPNKSGAMKYRARAQRAGHKVGRISSINERSGGRIYRYRLEVSKYPVR